MVQLAGDGDRPAMGLNNGLGNGKSHASSLHAISLIFPTIKLVENQSLFHIINTGPLIGDTYYKSAFLKFCCDSNRSLIG